MFLMWFNFFNESFRVSLLSVGMLDERKWLLLCFSEYKETLLCLISKVKLKKYFHYIILGVQKLTGYYLINLDCKSVLNRLSSQSVLNLLFSKQFWKSFKPVFFELVLNNISQSVILWISSKLVLERYFSNRFWTGYPLNDFRINFQPVSFKMGFKLILTVFLQIIPEPASFLE